MAYCHKLINICLSKRTMLLRKHKHNSPTYPEMKGHYESERIQIKCCYDTSDHLTLMGSDIVNTHGGQDKIIYVILFEAIVNSKAILLGTIPIFTDLFRVPRYSRLSHLTSETTRFLTNLCLSTIQYCCSMMQYSYGVILK